MLLIDMKADRANELSTFMGEVLCNELWLIIDYFTSEIGNTLFILGEVRGIWSIRIQDSEPSLTDLTSLTGSSCPVLTSQRIDRGMP